MSSDGPTTAPGDGGSAPDYDSDPDPVAALLLLTAAGLVVLYAGGLLVTDWLLTLAGPFTSLLVVGSVALWIRGYV